MKALVVYCHPRAESFNHAIKDTVIARLTHAGAEIRLLDLYADGFDPRMTAQGLEFIEDKRLNRVGIENHCAAIEWCDTIIFVYPTWWYGLPAVLKGWLDRVLVSGVAFQMPPPEGGDIIPNLTHIKRFGVYTTCGASWWLTRFIGAPGRRTLMRGVRLLCAKRCRTSFAAHYLMDSSTDASRKAHLARVARKVDRLVA
ncbi:putative NADPH-quinone reductase [Yoonia maritima]|uniref:Putative NADPH-quinone reductase n=1 Tax=Yoonia maritima TaxID=1435347 RepID=A0A2T0VYP1_9RHOB|nr:NAD(P)H-dependent oxidoreductase [Yoonia maritima]PRY77203.1 putative NADPH-quinone reductase [Yoonia maritima]